MYKRHVAIFILQDDEGRILLQHRDKNAPTLPDQWSFFGGGIEAGETPEEAVIREADEELGILLTSLKLFKRFVIDQGDGLYEKYVFIARLDIPIDQLKLQQKEGAGLGLFHLNEIKGLNFPKFNLPIIEKLASKSDSSS